MNANNASNYKAKAQTSVLIRLIEEQDKEPIREFLKRYHKKTIFTDFPFSDQKFDKHAETILRRPAHMVCLVAELDGDIIGFAWASAGNYAFSDKGVMTTCHIVAVDTDRMSGSNDVEGRSSLSMGDMTRRATTFLRLIKGIQQWSAKRGSKHVMIHVTTGVVDGGFDSRSAERLLQRIGGQSLGGSYLI